MAVVAVEADRTTAEVAADAAVRQLETEAFGNWHSCTAERGAVQLALAASCFCSASASDVAFVVVVAATDVAFVIVVAARVVVVQQPFADMDC